MKRMLITAVVAVLFTVGTVCADDGRSWWEFGAGPLFSWGSDVDFTGTSKHVGEGNGFRPFGVTGAKPFVEGEGGYEQIVKFIEGTGASSGSDDFDSVGVQLELARRWFLFDDSENWDVGVLLNVGWIPVDAEAAYLGYFAEDEVNRESILPDRTRVSEEMFAESASLIRHKLDGDVFTLGLGPTIGRRWYPDAFRPQNWRLSLAGGPAVTFVDMDMETSETLQVNYDNGTTETYSASSKKSKDECLWGGFVQVGLEYQANKNWLFGVSYRYDRHEDFEMSTDTGSVDIDGERHAIWAHAKIRF